MELASTSARSAVQQNIAVPLAAAGYRNITVNVSFDGEASKPTTSKTPTKAS